MGPGGTGRSPEGPHREPRAATERQPRLLALNLYFFILGGRQVSSQR